MHIPKYFAIIIIITIMQLSIKGIGARPYHVPLHSILCTLLLFPHGRSQPSSPYGSVNHSVSISPPPTHRFAVINAQSVKLSESWPKFKIFDFHEMLKMLAQGQKKVPRKTEMWFLWQFVSICSRCRQTGVLLAAGRKVLGTQMPVVILLIVFTVTI